MPAFALEQKVNKYTLEWDYARDGGAVGDIAFRGPQIPSGFRVTSAFVECLTSLTCGDDGTVSIKMNAGEDLLADSAYSGYTADTCTAGVPVMTAASSVKATADRTVYLTVAGHALTAGKIRLVLYGYHTSK